MTLIELAGGPQGVADIEQAERADRETDAHSHRFGLRRELPLP
jgi:hypothetical protein